MSHCVEAGTGIPRLSCMAARRLNGKPLPYLSTAIMVAALSSYLLVATPSGGGVVNSSPHRLQGELMHNDDTTMTVLELSEALGEDVG